VQGGSSGHHRHHLGVPKVFPYASPRRVVQIGFIALFAGIVVMVALLEVGAARDRDLAGAVLFSALTASFLTGVQNNPDVPQDLTSQAQVELAGGIPFLSDKDLLDLRRPADRLRADTCSTARPERIALDP
jgi:hypothetical protein